MAVLKIALALLALGACYSPELRNCAVACESNDDCGPGQLCGADRWCAAPAIAGRCELPDAAIALDAAASNPDAAADAAVPGPILLVVQIMGHGTVTTTGLGSCADTAPGHQCSYAVSSGVTRMLDAVGTGMDDFQMWTGACAGQGSTCTLTPTASTTVQAKFMH